MAIGIAILIFDEDRDRANALFANFEAIFVQVFFFIWNIFDHDAMNNDN